MTRNNRKWIIGQQFGGRKNFPLMPAALTACKVFFDKKLAKIIGTGLCDIIVEIDAIKDSLKWILNKNQFKKFCHDCFKKTKKNPEFQKLLIEKFQKKVPKFLNFCKKIMKNSLEEKSNKELWQYYKKYIKLYEEIYPLGEPFAFGSRFQLSDYLSGYLKKILNKKNQLDKFNDYFNILITPPQKPFMTEEKEELLKIALKIERGADLNKEIEKHTEK